MNRIVRLLGFCTIFLLIAISGLFYAQSWLGRKTEGLRIEAIEGKRQQLSALVDTLTVPTENELSTYIEKLSKVLNVEIAILRKSGSEPTQSREQWSFTHQLQIAKSDPNLIEARISFTPPPETKFRTMLRIGHLTILLSVLLLIIGTVTAILATQPRTTPEEIDSKEPFLHTKSEINSLTKLAQISQKQGQALESERIYRRRVEEDLHQNQQILTQILEEKIHLGRNLHDGVIQSLYATGLTLQTAQNQISTTPEVATKHIETSLGLINQTIREIRHYIDDLSPENLQGKTFINALDQQIKTLSPTNQAQFDLKLDEEAVKMLSDTQSAELLQITNEAISNSLRHGKAKKITIRLHQSEDMICFSIQDNGHGFFREKQSHRGHGLENLAARADSISANLKIDSSPGVGTRITLTMAVNKA